MVQSHWCNFYTYGDREVSAQGFAPCRRGSKPRMLSVTLRGDKESAHQDLHLGPFPCRGNVLLPELCAVYKNAHTRSRTSISRLSIGCSAVELCERTSEGGGHAPQTLEGFDLFSKESQRACLVRLPKECSAFHLTKSILVYDN